jgi:hypothetical protein
MKTKKKSTNDSILIDSTIWSEGRKHFNGLRRSWRRLTAGPHAKKVLHGFPSPN